MKMPTRIDWIASFRNLKRKPLYTLTVALALGIGVGAVTIVFSWFEGLFLRPIPGVRDSRSLQVFELYRADAKSSAFSYPDYVDLAEALTPAMDLSGYSMSRVTLSGGTKPETYWALFVSGNFFSVLDLKPSAGRVLGASDGVNEHVAVLGYDFWRTHFHADPTIIGRSIDLNRRPVKIVGIAPSEFQGPYTGLSLGLYLPISSRDFIEAGTPRLGTRLFKSLTLVSRLKPGVSAERASELVRVTTRSLDRANPKGTFDRAIVMLTPFWRSPVGAQALMGPIMMALGGIVLMVLLLACSNAAGIMLIENSARRRELSIRFSLGAGRGGLIRYRLAEAAILSVLAAGAALLFTSVAADHLQDLVPDLQFPVKVRFPIDAPVFGFGIVIAALAASFCGLWSGLEARWQTTALTLRAEASNASPSRDRSRLRGILIGAQVALSFLLLSTSALFYRSVEQSRTAHLGFDPRAVSLFRIDLSGGQYAGANGINILRTALARVIETPGVEQGSLATSVPLGFGNQERVAITPDSDAEAKTVWVNRVTSGYFAMLGVPLLGGRDFSGVDVMGAEPVAIVNEALANKIWNSPLPLGRSFTLGDRRYRIAGAVGNTKIWSLTQESQPCLYLPLLQSPASFAVMHVKSRIPSGTISRIVANEFERLDSSLPIASPQTMAQQVDSALFPQRIALVLLSLFSLLGIYLTAIGLYGTIAHAAQARAKEIAIRMALGAGVASVCRLVTQQAVTVVGTGLCAGAVLTFLMNQLLRSVLIGAGSLDPLSMIAVAVAICIVAMAATLVPLLRSVRLQPATLLRVD